MRAGSTPPTIAVVSYPDEWTARPNRSSRVQRATAMLSNDLPAQSTSAPGRATPGGSDERDA
ncbi:hypothetical protein I553_4203 [Mycobacterium xenopi 4042]|uniref:Uncharacterized protein n=1 Tax=Mycobacterium xenopi 4042 TaxID=1299334 RepID=X8AEI2_MYCXE|nr:hypothetical protein I553_4203 [Mycobacterium xenopi 4042]